MRVFYVAFFESGIWNTAGSGKTRRQRATSSPDFNDMHASSALSQIFFAAWKYR